MATPREVKVGAFVLLGLFAMGTVIFMIGEERQLFQKKADYQIVFTDVEGLKRGSPVRMGGVDVGSVARVAYSQNSDDPRLYVTISVVKDEARRIREDSVAMISDKGLLGDKMITISIGGPQKSALPTGGIIKSEESPKLSDMIGKLGSIGSKAEKVVANLEKTTGTLSEKEFQDDLKQSVHSLSQILKAVDEGGGYVSRFLHDGQEADKISRTLTNLEHTTAELSRVAGGAGKAVDRVNAGPGFAHDLVYGDAPTAALTHFGEAAGEVAQTLKGIREGNGLARSVIYGDDRSQKLMGDINAITTDVRGIISGVRQGKGTLGALLVDPSVYEDLKMVLGNVSRNKALRALVRWSIVRDEGAPKVQEAAEPASAGAAR